MTFDPNGVGIANGNIFGFPLTEEEADIVIIPVPWDATASYGKGTSRAPQAVLDASTQLDFYHPKLDKAYTTKVFMSAISDEWLAINDKLCKEGCDYISFLEDGGNIEEHSYFKQFLAEINEASHALKEGVKARAKEVLKNGKIAALLGGEHSTPLGLIEALDELGKPFGVLHIDAHADLRDAYEGFEHSHASILFNVLKNCKNVVKLTQVGIRDIAEAEVNVIKNSNKRVETFFDWDIKEQQFNGKNWSQQVKEIIATLPDRVYISFDIDSLCPELCPNTGTPVAGGFKLEEVTYLLFELAQSNKQIIGFDLNEVGTSTDSDWDANVGARALWNLVCATEKNRQSRLK